MNGAWRWSYNYILIKDCLFWSKCEKNVQRSFTFSNARKKFCSCYFCFDQVKSYMRHFQMHYCICLVAVHFCLAKAFFSDICLHLHCSPNTLRKSYHSYQKNKNCCPSSVHLQPFPLNIFHLLGLLSFPLQNVKNKSFKCNV